MYSIVIDFTLGNSKLLSRSLSRLFQTREKTANSSTLEGNEKGYFKVTSDCLSERDFVGATLWLN